MASPAQDMKARLRADLGNALKNKRVAEAQLIRSLLAALDHAEAPVVPAARQRPDQRCFHGGSAEIERLRLTEAQVHAVLLTEIGEREAAASQMERLGKDDRAEALWAELLLAKRYIE